MAKEERVTNWIVFTNNLEAKAPVFDDSNYPIKLDSNVPYRNIDFLNENYRNEYKEGIQVYIIKNCLDPRKYLTGQNLALTLSENDLKQFPMFSTERVEMWEEIRNITSYMVYMIFTAPFNARSVALNAEFEKDKRWGVLDYTVETVCDDCFTVVKQEEVVAIETNKQYSNLKWLCPACYKKLLKDTKIKDKNQGYVYFFFESPSGAVKIGNTSNDDVEKRRATLQIGNSRQLITLHKILSNDFLATERAFHKHFKPKMIKRGNPKRSEWFNLTQEDIDWIKKGEYTKGIQRTIDSHFHVVTDVEEYREKNSREFVEDILNQSGYGKGRTS